MIGMPYALLALFPFLSTLQYRTANSTSWRGGRPDHLNRQSSQRQNSGSGPRGTGPGGRGGQGANASGNWGGAREFQSGPASEQHVPVHGFNAAESKGALRRGRYRPRLLGYITSKFIGGHLLILID